jgi:hypothetical protein
VARALWEVKLKRNQMKRLIDSTRDFVKKEDPVLWLSLFIASIISLILYFFGLLYVRIAG